jgi:hypothetical protein
VCWEVQVRASEGNVENEAIWLADIALSLLRLLYPPNQRSGYFPRYSDVECRTGGRPTIRSRNVSLSKEGIQFGGWELPQHYIITQSVLSVFDLDETTGIVKALFEAPNKSLGERVARGLGWLTRGRQARDKAERHLYFFTALEALVGPADKNMQVTDAIARHLSVVLMSEPRHRLELARKVKKAYTTRSALVHAGHRNVSSCESGYLQELSEMAYWRVINKVDLRLPYEEFQRQLTEAGYGLPWPGTND